MNIIEEFKIINKEYPRVVSVSVMIIVLTIIGSLALMFINDTAVRIITLLLMNILWLLESFIMYTSGRVISAKELARELEELKEMIISGEEQNNSDNSESE